MALPIVAFAGNADIWVERSDMNPSRLVYIGDEIEFNIMIDTEGEEITGVAAYITIDPDFLQPVFPGNLPYGKPFSPGRFLLTGSAVINNTHLDSLHLYDQPGWGNGLDDFQLDYYQSTGPVLNGVRPSVKGIGKVASFKLRVVGMPDNANDSTAIKFDFKNDDNRLTTYYKLSEPSNEQRFGKFMNYSMFIAGFRIYPEIPDTLIDPASSLLVNLNDHVTSNSDNYEIGWSLTEQEALDGAVSSLDNDTLVTVTTTSTTKGVLKLKVTGVQKNTNYVDSQVFNVGVGYAPIFHSTIPTVTFYEDESITLAKSYFLSDQDDELTDIDVIPGSSNLLIEDVGDSIKFSAVPNWFGNETVELLAQDPVQKLVNDTSRTTINIDVISVNDPPVLDLTAIDPIAVFYGVVKHITMENGVYITDVDDEEFVWTVEAMDSVNLDASFINDNILRLESLDSQFIGNVELKITATDDEGELDSTRVNVYIQPTPVRLLPVPTIILLSGQSKEIELNDYVDYPQDIKSELFWSFEVINPGTNQQDNHVTVNYINSTQKLILTADAGHIAQDELYITVSAGNENRDTGKTLLKVLPENRLTLYPLPQVTIMQSMELDVLDLSRYVVDPIFSTDDITWNYSGGDSLEAIAIDPETHVLTLTADTLFLGTDSVKIIAMNPNGEQSSQWLKVKVIEFNPNPVFTTPLPDAYYYWKMMTPEVYVDLDDYIWDFSTHDSLINWRIDYNHLYMDITKNENNVVKIATFNKVGNQTVVFTATNLNGYSTSDTVIVTIAKLGVPIWRNIPSTIEISRGQVYSSIYLNRYCLSAGNEVTYTANYDVNKLDVDIDTSSTQVLISSVNGFIGNSTIVFHAANDDTSSVSNLVNVIVSQKSSVSCFFNSIVNNRVNFVVNSDVGVNSMDYRLVLEGVEQTLEFKKIDSTETQKIWMAPFAISRSGLYKLNLTFTFISGLTVNDSLWLTSQLSTDLGKNMVSADKKIVLNGSGRNKDSGMILLTESDRLAGSDGIVRRIYALASNGPEQEYRIMAQVEEKGNDYFAFYTLENNEFTPVETSTDGEGRFYCMMPLGRPFVFEQSDSPANRDYILVNGIAGYPNPFNSSVKIRYLLDNKSEGLMTVYNMLGQSVLSRSIAPREAGIHEIAWDSRNRYGHPVPSGVYFVRLTFGNKILTQKIMLLR